MPTSGNVNFLVSKNDLSRWQFEELGAPPATPLPGEVIFRVERFAFTSNNITYAAMGDILSYWEFFPAESGMGRIPAFGVAEVVASAHPDVVEGTRWVGFYPMSRYLSIQPASVTADRIVDGAAHRAEHSPTYREYTLTSGDARHDADFEDEELLIQGLFRTSFLAEDFLLDNDFFGAEQMIISSASSKTAIALGHIARKRGRTKTIGLTSKRNLEFTQSLGCYDELRLYDEIMELDAARPSVFVDLAGNDEVKRSVHAHFGDNLKFSQVIGITHWDAVRTDSPVPGPQPQMFFASEQTQKRVEDWGPAGLHERFVRSWTDFREWLPNWLTIRRGYGRKTVAEIYQLVLNGESLPSDGHVLSLWDDVAASRWTSP